MKIDNCHDHPDLLNSNFKQLFNCATVNQYHRKCIYFISFSDNANVALKLILKYPNSITDRIILTVQCVCLLSQIKCLKYDDNCNKIILFVNCLREIYFSFYRRLNMI